MAIKVEIEMATMVALQRKAELLDGALEWIWNCTNGVEEYARACVHIGMNDFELDNEMAECGLSKEETRDIFELIQ